MLFQSFEFILLFLPVTIAGYYLLANKTAKWWWLIAASILFYGCFAAWFPVWLFFSAGFTFLFAKGIVRCAKNKTLATLLTAAGIFAHLASMVFFKYEVLTLIGVSFTGFRQIAYLIDVKRTVFHEPLAPATDLTTASFTEYLTFITFFPSLVQGPITLFHDFLPQMRDESRLRFDKTALVKGSLLFITGLAKKVLLADPLEGVVRFGYENARHLDTVTIVLLLISYAFQLYFDFSGYCDMAQGVAWMLRFTLPDNFRSPFQATSIKALWQRWHISLSTFFTRYVYIPLGGSKKGRVRTVINVLRVFALSGIWHGAGWTYLVWGLLEGCFVVLEDAWKGKWKPNRAVTFALFCVGLIFFRAQDIPHALTLLRRLFVFTLPGFLFRMASQMSLAETYLVREAVTMLKPSAQNALCLALFLIFLAVCACIMFQERAKERIEKNTLSTGSAVFYAVLLVWSLLSLSGVSNFLYFAY